MTKSSVRICLSCEQTVVDHGGIDTHTGTCPGKRGDVEGRDLPTADVLSNVSSYGLVIDRDPQGNVGA